MSSITSILGPEMTYAIFQTLVHSLWQIAVITLVIKIYTARNFKNGVKQNYHANLAIILVSMITAFFTFIFYFFRSFEHTLAANEPAVISEHSLGPLAISESSQIQNSSFSDWLFINSDIIVLVWCLVALILMSRIIAGWMGLNILKRNLNFNVDPQLIDSFEEIIEKLGIKRTVRLAYSTVATIPLIIGHVKPIVLLPIATVNHLSTEEVESILTHELAHILHYDFIKNLIVIIGESLFFYHPMIWLVSNEIKEQRENLCDDTVVRIFPNRLKYAKTLVKLGDIYAEQNTQLSLALFNNKFKLMKRVKRILNIQNDRPMKKSRIALGVIMICGAILFSSAGFVQQLTGQDTIVVPAPPEPPQPPQVATFPLPPPPPPPPAPPEPPIEAFDGASSIGALKGGKSELEKGAIPLPPEPPAPPLPPETSKIPLPPAPPLAPASAPSIYFEDKVMMIDTLDPKEAEELREKLREKREEIRAKQKEERQKIREESRKIREEYREDLEKAREEMRKIRKDLGESDNDFEFEFNSDWNEEEMAEWAAKMAAWGQRLGQEISENIDEEWIEEMQALGQQWENEYDEEWAKDMQEWGEKYGEKMAKWGEKFGEKWSEKFGKDWEEKISNEWEDKFEKLEFQFENSFDEEWLEEMSKIGERVSVAVQKAMESVNDTNYDFDYSYGDTKDSDAVKVHLVNKLNDDGLLTDGTNSIIIKDDSFTVNGKKQSAELLEAYKSLIRIHAPEAFQKEKTKVKFKIKGKDLGTSKSTGLTIDIYD